MYINNLRHFTCTCIGSPVLNLCSLSLSLPISLPLSLPPSLPLFPSLSSSPSLFSLSLQTLYMHVVHYMYIHKCTCHVNSMCTHQFIKMYTGAHYSSKATAAFQFLAWWQLTKTRNPTAGQIRNNPGRPMIPHSQDTSLIYTHTHTHTHTHCDVYTHMGHVGTMLTLYIKPLICTRNYHSTSGVNMSLTRKIHCYSTVCLHTRIKSRVIYIMYMQTRRIYTCTHMYTNKLIHNIIILSTALTTLAKHTHITYMYTSTMYYSMLRSLFIYTLCKSMA